MNKSSNKPLMFGIVFFIILAVYNACLFLIAGGFEGHDILFWSSYIFMTVAFLDIIAIGIAFKTRSYKAKDWYLAFPVTKHATIYFVAELVISSIFMALDQTDCPAWLSIVVQLLILAVHIIFVVLCFMSKETIVNVQQKVKDKTTFTKLLQADCEVLAQKAEEPALRIALSKLAEQVRYSDPMSNDNLFELEKQITLWVNNIGSCMSVNDFAGAMECCNKASMLLAERNKKCIALK